MVGISLNQLSIVGLVVALGLLVDDSIVVVENIERWMREGHSRFDATIKATRQIGLAVVGCTMTLIIAFMPLVFLPEGAGDFIRGLPLAVIMSVLASMIVSLTVIPFLSSRVLKDHGGDKGNIFMRGLQKVIHGSYSRCWIKHWIIRKLTGYRRSCVRWFVTTFLCGWIRPLSGIRKAAVHYQHDNASSNEH
jgi:multidrug efflux pump subunit AcrB